MSENLNRLAYFVAIAEEGTITAAAARLRVSKAVVSKQLQLLEDDLGATLVLRNTRHFHLTETGEAFYEAARVAVVQAKDAFHLVRKGRDEPSGELRITAPLDFGIAYVAPAVAAFSLLYPALAIDLTLSDTRFDPVEARFDIAFRVGWLEDSANTARKLTGFSQVMIAAPSIVETFGMPQTLDDLARLPFIENRALKTRSKLTFTDERGQIRDITFQPSVSGDTTQAVLAVAKAGGGIANMPDFAVVNALETGKLIDILPEFALPSGTISAVFPPTPYRSAATRKFTDFFFDNFRQEYRRSNNTEDGL
ncbi:DNA-binding transcriptional regulator, LysR family [Parasphingorhabdus marina DSM 22363]|uniref:DNA-binding transcriptional regulator, LysR family n=1 Tax=Parasphingorhabdus marina DSM 22363 TaxID=1123272 RepID=A0A1N6D8S5_9SPHN|nr:LysR family transcriptional regulator [Parasphingorhabdus marina]SIN67221.1 DNA-binding transcriptional regulator, LysR family [Parasphingorhabdus marina DSM 22363]